MMKAKCPSAFAVNDISYFVFMFNILFPNQDLLAGRSQSPPEILISLCYMPTSGRLTFVALKGKNLKIEEMETGGM